MNTPGATSLQGRSWRRLLHQMVHEYGLWAAVLTDFQGLPFAAALHEARAATIPADERQYLVDILAAFAPPLLRLGQQLEGYVGTFQTDEISMRTVDGTRIVSRLFYQADGSPLILTVLVPPHRAYRRAMNRTLRLLKDMS